MTVSESNMTPGEVLIAAREKASLSLDQVAESTRIAPNMLRAIELDEYHKISGDLYVKSFLRSYAQAVELEPEELIELYLVYTGEAGGESSGTQPSGWEEQDVKITKVGLPWGWIILAVCVVAGGGYLYYWLSGKSSAELPVDEPVVHTPVSLPASPEPRATGADSGGQIFAGEDTLAWGWQQETPREPVVEASPAGDPPGSGKAHLPLAYPGNSQVSFDGGQHWAYVVRVISEMPGDFAIKRDAESSFHKADFPGTLAEAKPLPTEDIVSGRAYAVKRGFVVYWGADDHMSLRLGQIQGVEVNFNGFVQDVTRFRIGEEILLDSSRLDQPAGN